MIENIKKEIDALLSALKTTYSQPGQIGAKLVPILFLLVICCLCSVTFSLLRPRNSPSISPSPDSFPTLGTVETATPLFNFGGATFTPFPTFPGPTPFPTFTLSSTSTPTLTPVVPTATQTPLATATNTLIPTDTSPPPTATRASSVLIINVNKREEYVEIQNTTNTVVNLRGWRLVSESGNQSCPLRGNLDPNEVLRIWSRRGNPGFDCRFPDDIWRDNENDPAVLYNPQGEEVSRFP
jgi:hypothetical protein